MPQGSSSVCYTVWIASMGLEDKTGEKYILNLALNILRYFEGFKLKVRCYAIWKRQFWGSKCKNKNILRIVYYIL